MAQFMWTLYSLHHTVISAFVIVKFCNLTLYLFFLCSIVFYMIVDVFCYKYYIDILFDQLQA